MSFLLIFSVPSKYVGITAGNCWKNLFLEYFPFIVLIIKLILKVLPELGLPNSLKGIFITIEMNNINIFSFNKSFLYISSFISILSIKKSSSIFIISLKYLT